MIAASGWDEPAQLMTVRPSTPGSYERLFHDAGLPAFVLPMEDAALRSALEAPRLERAIGVIYRPDTERASHYFTARLPEQFDMVIHIDTTRAVQHSKNGHDMSWTFRRRIRRAWKEPR